ncbi:MAG: citrate synthase [Chloroflexi bacterium]|nr:citrate synthase [Chloroflexota bacterium]MCL5109714.1 citrate synthase [Chloroflexota bacterium]
MTDDKKKPSGLEGVVAASSAICTVEGETGKLLYYGYDVRDLAGRASFEEIVHLLWYGELPTRRQLAALSEGLAMSRALPDEVIAIIRAFPEYSQPMEVLRTVVSSLSAFDRNACYYSHHANMCKAVRLTAQIPTVVAAFQRIRNGKDPVQPRNDLGHAANFIYMMDGQDPSEVASKAMDTALVLHAEHELNASTFAARVSAATLADMYSAITSAIGTLSGPLHGGANEQALEMLLEIGGKDKVEDYVHAAFAEKKKIPGFGHRVYRNEDPRATFMHQMAKELSQSTGNTKIFEMTEMIEQLMLKEKNIHANVDLYSANVYYLLGIPPDLFTPIFAVSRIAGWTAHVMEQYNNNRLIRPRAEYIGPWDRHFVPIEERVGDEAQVFEMM